MGWSVPLISIWLGVIAAAMAIAGYAAYQTRRRRVSAMQRATAWGSARPRKGEEDQIARYHRMLAEADENVAGSQVGEQEWCDLGMDDLFTEIDRTSGAPGQQLLYHRLRVPARSREEFAALGKFETSTHRFSDDVGARERAQATLSRLDDSAAYALPRLFLAPLPPKSRLTWLFPFLAVASLAMMVAAFSGVAHGWEILLVLLCVNFVVRHLVAADIAWIAEPFRALKVLMKVADRLAEQGLFSADATHAARVRLARMKRVTALIGLVEGAGDDVLRAFVDYFNMLFLIDLNVFALALVECERRRDDVRVVFEAVGDLDAAVAVASFRAGRSAWCRPVILTKGSGLGITAFAHPLLRDARTNEIDLPSGRGIVITGSNMSGKTTLLRALGVNVILAQTIHTCVASRFVCPPLVVRTAIALSDSLLDGKSYYLTEATTVLSMVGADETVQHLFLLDEMFRGTNTAERIAAGVAVMESLVANGNMAVVATHDADVVHFTRDTYDAQHFAESVTPAGLAFDFVLRPGQATGRNAISLLAALGAPDALLFRASQICAELENGEAIDAAEPASC